jgi:hypothetical protein
MQGATSFCLIRQEGTISSGHLQQNRVVGRLEAVRLQLLTKGSRTRLEMGRRKHILVLSINGLSIFYFTNFPAQLSNFYLRKGFEVCGILEDVVVPSKRNVNGEIYGFVRFSKVKDVDKLLKVVNDVCFKIFRVMAKVVRFDRSAAIVGKKTGVVDGVGAEGSSEGGRRETIMS